MAHLNCLPPWAAGVNDWFFLLADLVMGVGIKQNVKCEMLLRKIDSEMNVQNCGFSAKLRNGDGGDMLHDWRQRQLSRTRALIFRRDDTLSTSKNIAGNDQTTLVIHRNSANIACTFRIYVCLRLCDRDCCSAADGSGTCHAPVSSYVEEMTRCRRQKLHSRWPGTPNGRSKFRNLGLFTFSRSKLMLRRRIRGWWRLPEIAQTSRCRRQKHRRNDQNRSENLCLRDQAKRLEKLLFAATNDAAIDGIAQCLLSCYHSQRLLFSHSKNNFSTTLTPTEKPRYTYCRVFCRFYL